MRDCLATTRVQTAAPSEPCTRGGKSGVGRALGRASRIDGRTCVDLDDCLPSPGAGNEKARPTPSEPVVWACPAPHQRPTSTIADAFGNPGYRELYGYDQCPLRQKTRVMVVSKMSRSRHTLQLEM